MKIGGTCHSCSREFLAEQVVASGGGCPWCGVPFAADYAVTLVNALREAEEAGTELERAFTAIADLGPGFDLTDATITGELRHQLGRRPDVTLARS